MMTDTRLKPFISPIPEELHMDDNTTADEQAYSYSGEDIRRDHIPTVNLRQKNSLLAQIGDMATFMDWYCKKQGISKLTQTDLEGPAYEIVKVQCQQTTIAGWPTLSISKMKAAYYPDVGLEQMIPNQMWIEEECKYDVAVIIEVFPIYGYNYMKKIVLRRADLKEYVIAERDFKYLYPGNFEDLYLLNLQGHLNHLSPEEKDSHYCCQPLWTKLGYQTNAYKTSAGGLSYQTQLNLTKPRWDAKGFEYKHDFTVIDSPRAVTFRDKYGVQMIMRFNEIYKFSDGTLQ
ncbi:hypothetical protein Tco_0356799 [Tanacetum coccineum]